MENWLMLSRLLVLIYAASLYIDGSSGSKNDVWTVIFFLLIYVILTLCKALVKNKRLKTLFLLCSLLELSLCYFYINPLFIFFLPINLIELCGEDLKPPAMIYIMAASLLLTEKSISKEYGILAGFCYTVYLLAFKSQGKLSSLSKKLDDLREKNHQLLLKMNRDEEYRTQSIYTSQIEERNKIAQEIHDKLGHSISAGIMQLEASKLLMGKDRDKSKALLESTIALLRNGAEDIRSTLKNIKPLKEQLGINKVKLLAEEFSKNSGVSASLFYRGDLDNISFQQWKVIYENIGEALTNAMKYSQASNVKITVEVINKLIKTEIKDDGKGCEKVLKGLGLSGIEERTANLQGQVIIDGSDGFSVIALLPVRNG